MHVTILVGADALTWLGRVDAPVCQGQTEIVHCGLGRLLYVIYLVEIWYVAYEKSGSDDGWLLELTKVDFGLMNANELTMEIDIVRLLVVF